MNLLRRTNLLALKTSGIPADRIFKAPQKTTDIPGSFDAANFFPQIDYIVNVKHGLGSGKQALPVIARAILERVLTQPINQWGRMTRAIQQQGEGRHIQMYFHQPELASAAEAAKFDGRILTNGDDYLLAVDANVGAYTLYAALRPGISTLAFEPSPGRPDLHLVVADPTTYYVEPM